MSRTFPSPAALVIAAMVAVISAGCGGTRSGGGSTTPAPPAATGSSGGNTTVSIRRKAVKFAECMRANGVSAFPDPSASGETIDGIANGSSLDTNSAVFEQALRACKHLEPPGFTGTKVTPEQRRARLQFARCVRANGVRDFPDPTPNGPLIDTNRIPSTAKTGGMSNLKAAAQECGRYAAAAGVQGNE